jgi:hypothetical protein
MTKPDVIFVNTMAVSGFLNGNVNLSFTTARFTAVADETGEVIVQPDEYPSLFLRMDLACAQQVRAALDKIIEQSTKPAGLAN